MSESHRRQRNRNFMAAWKVAHGCFVCGYDADPLGLEFDHITPVGQSNGRGGTLYNASLATVMRRLVHDNIQVLCGTCHNIKTGREWEAQRV